MIAKNTPEFQEYLKLYSSRDLITLECPQCGISFARKKHDLQSKFGPFNDRRNIYCSRQCLSNSLVKKENVICAQCGKSFYKPLNQIKKTKNNFCSSICSGIYFNSHKTTGCRRSKLEIWIEEQLKIIFPLLIIFFNDIKTINLELDIYIPSLKIAFEINGIFHYKPIYGDIKFENIKINDNKRKNACLIHNIELITIDISLMKKIFSKRIRKIFTINSIKN